jgi:hypothetical protein
VSYFVEVNSGGGHVVGSASVTHAGTSVYTISFGHSVAGCGLVASPAAVAGGLTTEAPPGSTVVVSHDGENAVVHTYSPTNQPQDLPFALIAAC